jgi:hypothetical protein
LIESKKKSHTEFFVFKKFDDNWHLSTWGVPDEQMTIRSWMHYQGSQLGIDNNLYAIRPSNPEENQQIIKRALVLHKFYEG